MLAYKSSSLRSATIGELYPATLRDGELLACEHQLGCIHTRLPDGPEQSRITPFFQYTVGMQVQYNTCVPTMRLKTILTVQSHWVKQFPFW